MSTVHALAKPILFDPRKPSDIIYVLGKHRKNEEEFQYMALLHPDNHNEDNYNKVKFSEIIFDTEIVSKITDPGSLTGYKNQIIYCVQLQNISAQGDPAKFVFTVEERGTAVSGNGIVFYPLELFIAITEFYQSGRLGGKIENNKVEFSSGSRINIAGGIDEVILFRFKSETKGMQFYDYSSEDPTLVMLTFEELFSNPTR